jgi:Lrp/AsnC family leucine-responsive transcriptional regulator
MGHRSGCRLCPAEWRKPPPNRLSPFCENPVDKFDRQIIALLRSDARTPVTRIAESVALSRSAVAERIRQLEERGVIQGYHARVADPESNAIKAYLELFYHESRCEQYVERMRAFPEIQRCSGISGETDMLVYLEVASMARLGEIRGQIENFPGMQRVKTHVVVTDWAF